MKALPTAVLVVLFLLAGLVHSEAVLANGPAPTSLVAAQTASGDNLPAAEVSATRSSPLIWLAPITLGVLAFILVLVIRRYSKPRRQHLAQSRPVEKKVADKKF